MAKVIKEDLDTKNNGTAAEATLAPNSKPAPVEKSKSELMASVVAAMGGIEHGDLTKFAESLTMNTGANQSKAEGGADEKNRATITAKGVAAQAMKEDVVEMFKGKEGMTEELLNSATVLFEAAVNTRVGLETARIQDELDKKNEEKLKEEIVSINEELNTKIDQYLSFAVTTWAEENQVAIDDSIKSQIALDFTKGLKKLFKEHYIKIPKKKLDVVEQLSTENTELQKKLDETTKANIQMTEQLNAAKKHEVVESASVGLSVTQVEKLKTLTENVDFENVDAFKKKVDVLKESYFQIKPVKKDNLLVEDDKGIAVDKDGNHVDGNGKIIAKPAEETKSDNPAMKRYLDTIEKQTRVV